jgi:hypothetical protein
MELESGCCLAPPPLSLGSSGHFPSRRRPTDLEVLSHRQPLRTRRRTWLLLPLRPFPTLFSASSILDLAARSANRIYESLLHYLALVIPTAALGTVLETFNETAAAGDTDGGGPDGGNEAEGELAGRGLEVTRLLSRSRKLCGSMGITGNTTFSAGGRSREPAAEVR